MEMECNMAGVATTGYFQILEQLGSLRLSEEAITAYNAVPDGIRRCIAVNPMELT